MNLANAFLLLIALASPAIAHAEWKYVEYKDQMTDKVEKSAIGIFDGYSITIKRMQNGRAWLFFRVPEQSGEIIKDMLSWRIDDHKHEDLSTGKRLQKIIKEPIYIEGPKSAGWLIWHGDGPIEKGAMLHIATGKRVLIRYSTYSDLARTIEIPLEGAREPILQALGAEIKEPPALGEKSATAGK